MTTTKSWTTSGRTSPCILSSPTTILERESPLKIMNHGHDQHEQQLSFSQTPSKPVLGSNTGTLVPLDLSKGKGNCCSFNPEVLSSGFIHTAKGGITYLCHQSYHVLHFSSKQLLRERSLGQLLQEL